MNAEAALVVRRVPPPERRAALSRAWPRARFARAAAVITLCAYHRRSRRPPPPERRAERPRLDAGAGRMFVLVASRKRCPSLSAGQHMFG